MASLARECMRPSAVPVPYHGRDRHWRTSDDSPACAGSFPVTLGAALLGTSLFLAPTVRAADFVVTNTNDTDGSTLNLHFVTTTENIADNDNLW